MTERGAHLPPRAQGLLQHRGVSWALLALLALVGLAARLKAWPHIFPEGRPAELIPADSHYYVRFALRQLWHLPHFQRFDPYVSFPSGAAILWPPLHTGLVAAAVALAGREAAEAGAALVGPFAFLLGWLLLGLLLQRARGGAEALLVLGLLALSPLAVADGSVGNADHHVHEAPLTAALLVALPWALCRGRVSAAVGVGLLLGLGRLLTPSGFLLLPCAALGLAVHGWHTRAWAPLARTAAGVGLGACVSLALGTLAFGEPLSLEYTWLSSFHPLLALALFGTVAAIAGLRAWPARRGAWALLLLALGAAVLLGPQVARALAHAGRGDFILSQVGESRPPWREPSLALSALGAPLLLLPLGLWGLARAARRAPTTLAMGAMALPLLALCALQLRFCRPGAGALAVVLAQGLLALRPTLRPLLRRSLVAVGGLLGVVSLTVLLPEPSPLPYEEPRLRSLLTWLQQHSPPVGEAPQYGVLAPYPYGHLVTLWAERPALATPFSQAPVHVEANQQANAVLAARDEEEAFARARALRVRYVLAAPFSGTLGVEEEAGTLVDGLLEDALLGEGREGSAHFRLLLDSAEQRNRPEGGSVGRLFEVVPGALLDGEAPPGVEVSVRLALGGPGGARYGYVRHTRAGPDGRFRLRLAYDTEALLPVQAEDGGYALAVGPARCHLQVSLAAVRQGRALALHPDCSGLPESASPRASHASEAPLSDRGGQKEVGRAW